MSRKRCCNIDWLEVHALENVDHFPMSEYYFQQQGYAVVKREYGTRVYEEMFTLLDEHGQPFIEVRRAPKSSNDMHGVLDPLSCHIRLSNAYCYVDNPARIMRDFLARHGYTFRRIFRIDLCLDFERFDLGDDPQKFVTRYIAHKYAKINQANRTTRGTDRWDGCDDNYISWGQPKSMVSTKIYNKTKELKEAKDKPYIKYAWWNAGLVDDPVNLTKVDRDGHTYTPTIWRVEFSVKSGAAGWAILDDCTGAKTKKKPIENNLSCYDTGEKILQMFASLAHHYFHFKYYEPNQRKDRCKDKVLFCFNFGTDVVAKLTRPVSSQSASEPDRRLKIALQHYSFAHGLPEVRKACQVLIEHIDQEQLRTMTEDGWSATQLNELQLLLRERLRQPEEDFQVTLERVRRLLIDNSNSF